ncbi:predicted protein, partial [Nematostella vectensis]
ERYCDLDRKETQMDFITKFSRKLEKDLDDPDYTEEIEDELCILLKRWTNIQEALEGATDRVIHRNRKLKGGGDKGNGCCLMERYCDLDRKETQMDFITKFSRKLEKDLDDPDYTEEIEDELCILLKRWTNIQEALEGATDRVIHRNRKLKGGGDKGNGCCLMVAFRKKMSTMCAYK